MTEDNKSAVIGLITLLIVVGGIGWSIFLSHHATASSPTNPITRKQETISNPIYNPPQPAPSYTTADIVNAFNTIRKSEDLYLLTENSQLDAAAQARSDQMVSQNIRDNTSGNPVTLIQNSGYTYSSWSLQSTWDQPTAQAVAKSISSVQGFGISDMYSDIGVGISTVSGNQKLVAVFIAVHPNNL